jgi:ribulose-phosphate 3-epimerase
MIAPSILAADFSRLAEQIAGVEKAGADLLHLDVMDGHFVPNLTIGPPVIAAIRQCTKLPLDVHLMIAEPGRLVDEFIRSGADWVSVHVEADHHLHRTIHHIQSHGIRAGIALNPATPLGALDEVLPDVDFVLVMSVNPGFGGQKFIPSTLHKIRKLRETISFNNYRAKIEVDGGVDAGNLHEIIAAGAEVVVAGSAVFRSRGTPTEALLGLKAVTALQAERL